MRRWSADGSPTRVSTSTIQPPGDSTDAPKLLAAGRTDFAVMDINDLGTAAERGFELAPIGALVQVPLASVIAADGAEVKRPRDLESGEVGVTGLPSDDAVLDAIVEADGGDPATIERTVIGFDAIAALSAGRVDAATAFWNAEGVALKELGVPTREFRVGDFAAEPYPELVVVTTDELAETEPDVVEAMQAGLERGYELAAEDPDAALEELPRCGRWARTRHPGGTDGGARRSRRVLRGRRRPEPLEPERYRRTGMRFASKPASSPASPADIVSLIESPRAGGCGGTAGARIPGGPTSA